MRKKDWFSKLRGNRENDIHMLTGVAFLMGAVIYGVNDLLYVSIVCFLIVYVFFRCIYGLVERKENE